MTNVVSLPGRIVRRIVPPALLLLISINLHAQLPMAIALKGAAEVPAVMTAATGTVSESSAKAYVTVRLSAATSQTVTIPVAFGGTATRLSTGDYTPTKP